MQKWCPEPLVPIGGGSERFEPTAPVAAAVHGRAAAFRPEAGFADADTLLRALSRSERAEVVALLDQDLRREFEQRHAQQREECEARVAAIQQETAEALATWQGGLAHALREHVDSTLAAWARRLGAIAVMMAAKIVRREVDQDPTVLVRALETVLFKAEAGTQLTVTLHPDDAAWLETAADLRHQLRIGAVKTDRRLSRGGCLIKGDDVEWDATVERQLAVLGEVLDEMLAVPPDRTPRAEGGSAEEDDHA